MTTRLKHRTFSLEQLEERLAPATFGTPWPDPERLSISFAPDSTTIGHSRSEMFQTLNGTAAQGAWQTEILRAFQTWVVHINANIALVKDTGSAFGAIGLSQHDPRFGDIRIAGFDQARDILANNVPFQPAAGSWSGDVFLNTAASFGVGTGIDLFSAMINEAGNVLGLADNLTRSSVMYTNYAGVRSGLSAQDITDIKTLYGARTPDALEGAYGNNFAFRATSIRTPLLLSNSDPVRTQADLTTRDDVDFYKFRAPLNATQMSIRLQTDAISLLTGKVSVFDSAGRLIETARATGPMDGDVAVQLKRVMPGASYTVKVEKAVDNVFGIGAYALELDFDPLAEPVVTTVDNTVDLVDQIFSNIGLLNSEGSHGSFDTALELETPPGYSANTRYEAVESVGTKSDADMYRFRTPAMHDPVFVLTLGALGDDAIDFRLAIYDSQRQPIKAQIHTNPDGTLRVELPDVKPDADYFVKVGTTSTTTGNYFLVIDIGSGSAEMTDIAGATLGPQDSRDFASLSISKSQLFRFDLSADAEGNAQAAIRMTIYDRDRNAIFSMTAFDGQALTRYVWLDLGEYVVVITRLTADEKTLMTYKLRGAALSDDVGPMEEDPTESTANDPAGSGGAEDTWTEHPMDYPVSDGSEPESEPWEEDYAYPTGSSDPAYTDTNWEEPPPAGN